MEMFVCLPRRERSDCTGEIDAFHNICVISKYISTDLILVSFPEFDPIRGSLAIHFVPLYKNWVFI
jgi:hypothetical protein